MRSSGLSEDRGQLICGLKCGDGWRLSIIWQPSPRSPQPPSCTYTTGDLGCSILSYCMLLVLHAKSIPETFEYCLPLICDLTVWLEALTVPTASADTCVWHTLLTPNGTCDKLYNLIKLMRSLSFHGLNTRNHVTSCECFSHINKKTAEKNNKKGLCGVYSVVFEAL